jgi:hypothetical protein
MSGGKPEPLCRRLRGAVPHRRRGERCAWGGESLVEQSGLSLNAGKTTGGLSTRRARY